MWLPANSPQPRRLFACALSAAAIALTFGLQPEALALEIPEPPGSNCNCNKALEAELTKQLSATRKQFGESSTEYLFVALKMADLQSRKRDFKRSNAILVTTLKEARTLRNAELQAQCNTILSRNAMYNHNLKEAEGLARQAFDASAKIPEKHSKTGAQALWQLSRTLAEQKRYLESIRGFEKAFTLLDQYLDAEDKAFHLQEMAAVYQNLGDWDAASQLLEKSLSELTRRRGAKNANVDWVRELLANTYIKSGDYKKARTLLLESIKIREATFGTGNPQLIGVLSQLAIAEDKLGNRKAASEARVRVTKITGSLADH